MFVTKKRLSRRAVLRGAGATLALPLLDSMVPALTALSQTPASPARLRRLGVFYVPNGMSMGYWWPKTEGPLANLPPTLQALNGLKDHVLLLGGLADKPADLMEGGGDHARSAGTFLTATTFKLTTGADVYAAVSMDQVAAQELAKQTQLTSLELGIESNAMVGTCDGGSSCAYTNTIAWRTPTTPLPVERDPRAVFERLFGTSGSTDPAARLARLERDRTIIDAVSSELARLQRKLGQATGPRCPSTSIRCATSSGASKPPSDRARASCRSWMRRPASPTTTPRTQGFRWTCWRSPTRPI